jgi:hypothetical protein
MNLKQTYILQNLPNGSTISPKRDMKVQGIKDFALFSSQGKELPNLKSKYLKRVRKGMAVV